MDIPRTVREELNALSKEVLGSAGKWQKFLKNGTTELVTITKVQIVPADEKAGTPETTKEVQEPVLAANGTKQWYTKRYTLDEIRERLLELKVKRDEILAAMKKQEAAKKAQEEAEKRVKETAHGSAV